MIYQIVPIVALNGHCTVPDEILAGIWADILNEHKYDDLFYDGGIRDVFEWIDFMKSPLNYPVIVLSEEKIVAVAWLNYAERKSARCHFITFGQYHKGIGETIINYWKDLKGTSGNRLLSVLIGVTPATNEKMGKLMEIIGFTILGEIPHYCYIAKDDKLVGATIGYLDLTKEA